MRPIVATGMDGCGRLVVILLTRAMSGVVELADELRASQDACGLLLLVSRDEGRTGACIMEHAKTLAPWTLCASAARRKDACRLSPVAYRQNPQHDQFFVGWVAGSGGVIFSFRDHGGRSDNGYGTCDVSAGITECVAYAASFSLL